MNAKKRIEELDKKFNPTKASPTPIVQKSHTTKIPATTMDKLNLPNQNGRLTNLSN